MPRLTTNDLPWIAAAKALLRLPGESVGADEEVRFAIGRGIRIFTDVSELIAAKDAI
jgi:hypothetical protein